MAFMDNSWRLVCHNCSRRYPMGAAINVSGADCCENPNIHVHSTDKPCSFCDSNNVTPAAASVLRGMMAGWLDNQLVLGVSPKDFKFGELASLFEELAAVHGATTKKPAVPDETCDGGEYSEREKRLVGERDAALGKLKAATAMTDEVRGVAFERQEEIDGLRNLLTEAQNVVRERGVLLKRVQSAVRASGDHRDAVDAVEALAAWVWPSREAAGGRDDAGHKLKAAGKMADEVRGTSFGRQEEIDRLRIKLTKAQATLDQTREASKARFALLTRVRVAMGAVCWEGAVEKVEAMAPRFQAALNTVRIRGVLLKRVQAAVRAPGDHQEVVNATEIFAAEVWAARDAAAKAYRDVAGQDRSLVLGINAVVRKRLESVDHNRPGWPRTMTVEEAAVVKGWPNVLTMLLNDAGILFTQVDGLRAELQISREDHTRELAETKRLLDIYRNAEETVWIVQVKELCDILKAGAEEGVDEAATRVMGERDSAQMAHGRTLERLSQLEDIDVDACLEGQCDEHDMANECLDSVSARIRTVGKLVREILVARGES